MFLEVVLENWEKDHKGIDLSWEKQFVSVLPGYVDSVILDMWGIEKDNYLLNDIAWKVAYRITDEGFAKHKELLHFIIDNYLYSFIEDEGYEINDSFNDTIKWAVEDAMKELLSCRAIVNYYTKQYLIRYYKENIDADLINFPHNKVDEIIEKECFWGNFKEVCDKIIKECFKYKKVTFELELPTNTNVNDVISYIHDKFDGNVNIK